MLSGYKNDPLFFYDETVEDVRKTADQTRALLMTKVTDSVPHTAPPTLKMQSLEIEETLEALTLEKNMHRPTLDAIILIRTPQLAESQWQFP